MTRSAGAWLAQIDLKNCTKFTLCGALVPAIRARANNQF
jgi:hypothetical protein